MFPIREWTRRDFLHASLIAAGWGAMGARPWQVEPPPPLPRRPLGKTGLEVSVLGLGAFPVGAMGDEKEALAVVQRLIDLGVNYLDTAPSYSRRESERRLGKAIRGRREKVIIATKTLPRKKEDALRDLEGSLEHLGTDHVDIWQIHSITSHDDLDRVFDDRGPVRAAEEAIKAGKVRFVGVTGHTHPDLNLRAIREYDFDTILMPLNAADPHHLSFEEQVLPEAVRKEMGVIAMKVLAAGRLPQRAELTAEECLRYAYSLPVSCAIVGLKSMQQVKTAVAAARLSSLSEEKMAELASRITDHPGKSLEWYKKRIAPRGDRPRRKI